MSLDGNLKRARKKAKLTQAELAKQIGVWQHVLRAEKKTINPINSLRKRIAQTLKVSIDDLVYSESEKSTECKS